MKIQTKRRVIIITSLEWWTRLALPLASLLWTIPVVVVVQVGAALTGLGAIIPRESIITTDLAHEVQVHGLGVVFSMLFELGPFIEVLQ